MEQEIKIRDTLKIEITSNSGSKDWTSRFMMSDKYFNMIFGGELTEETHDK